ncbi:unnamed protein product, partial [Nippostrongylus brasiliensis]|uniref:Autophagy-related protein 13 homolog (inferred by orthology to a C. elegans protein) n=1 Tax=Nippostrongylus brasiliensis TaxID=27835 RepID=A0A0N4YC00_NIPBR
SENRFDKPSTQLQVVVQSRTNDRYDVECTLPNAGSPDWFNLRIEELGEVTAQVKRSITSFPPVIKCMCIDFMLYTCDGEVLPMETWTFSVEEDDQQMQWGTDIKSLVKSELYRQLGVLLRSAMVAARMTPLHRYYVKKQGEDTFVILYKIGEGPSELDLGSEAKRLELGRFPTPVGAFRLELAYRTQMTKERAMSPGGGHESPNQMSIIMAATPEVTPAVGSPTPSSYCELMSEFSTSPSSLAAASPPGATSPGLKTGRSRSTSLASEGEHPTGSPKPKPVVPVVKNIPFANLLTVSYTGALFPLPEELIKRKKCNSESAIVVGTESNAHPPRSDSFSRLLCHTSPIEEEEKKSTEENQFTQMELAMRKEMEDLRVEDHSVTDRPPVKVSFELELSERTLVDHDSDSQTEGSRKGDMDVDEQDGSVATIKQSAADTVDTDEVAATSDDDSFVKIPLFGRASGAEAAQEGEMDVHLTEFMTSCKTAPQLEAVHHDWDTLSDIKSLLDGFSQKQGAFDKFVAEVREHGDNSD